MGNKIEFNHVPVMLGEAIEALNIKPDGLYVDCTTGGGGHSREIAKRLNENGRLICFDRDVEAINAAKINLREFDDRITYVNRNFSDFAYVLDKSAVDGVLIDLGISSYQIDNPERGFSYMKDAPLDMRMNKEDSVTAYDVVNGYSKDELVKILYEYGEERFANKIAASVVNAREEKPIETTLELVRLLQKVVGAGGARDGGHPAKRTFQAIRIEVNGELTVIEPAIRSIVDKLKLGGRLAIITFHSLEDRIVKQTYAKLAKGCICPPKFPICVCGIKPTLKILSKGLLPSENELQENSRSRSAKLRVAEKI